MAHTFSLCCLCVARFLAAVPRSYVAGDQPERMQNVQQQNQRAVLAALALRLQAAAAPFGALGQPLQLKVRFLLAFVKHVCPCTAAPVALPGRPFFEGGRARGQD